MRWFLQLLREKLTGVVRWLRSLVTIQFASPPQRAQDHTSTKTAPVSPVSKRPPPIAGISQINPSASPSSEDATTQKFEPQLIASKDQVSDESGWPHATSMTPQSQQSGGLSKGFQPNDHEGSGIADIDLGRADLGGESPSEVALTHEVGGDTPSDLQSVAPDNLLTSPFEPQHSHVETAGEARVDSSVGDNILSAHSQVPAPDQTAVSPELDPLLAATEENLPKPDTDDGMTATADERMDYDVGATFTDAAVQPESSEHDVHRQYSAKDDAAAPVEQENIDADRVPEDSGDGPPPASRPSIDVSPGNNYEDDMSERESDGEVLTEDLDDLAGDTRPPASTKKRPRTRVDIEHAKRPVLVTAPPIEDIDYRLWNQVLAKHCLSGYEHDEALYLTITPTILAAALYEVQSVRRLPEEAEDAFVKAVTAVYHTRVLGHREKLRVLRRCGPDGLPDCIAFLAVSVLAAYYMRSDEEAAANAYYSRLAELLKCDLIGGRPQGFDPDEFESLWRFLAEWLRTERSRPLAMPGSDVGIRRFVALPLTHVPLRRVDIDRLPEFFAWMGYEPGAKIARSKLDQDLALWCAGRSPFTNAGMAALVDERRVAVIAQIAHELEAWDGSQTDSLGRRSGRVEIFLDIIQRRPELFYLPRRPPAFPQIFDDGVHFFEASDEGWYDPVPIRGEDGRDLTEGFEWQITAGRLHLMLRRPGVRAIALPESSEYTGFLSHRALPLGAPGAVLCVATLADLAADYLSVISGKRCIPLNLPGLPEGWRLFTGIKPNRKGEVPPAGLEALAVESDVNLIPVGGLRLGSRWAWLAGAPPSLIMAGLEVGEQVTIDGKSVTVPADGMLTGDDYLTQPGTHVIEAAGRQRRIEIIEPQIRGRSQDHDMRRTAVALPGGSWTLLGVMPGEVSMPAFRSRNGALASCTYSAVWAVESAAGPGARVICLSAKPTSPGRAFRLITHGPTGRSLWTWASAIYNAAIRRPYIEMLDGQECGPGVRRVWAEYVQAAREVKRQLRKGRR